MVVAVLVVLWGGTMILHEDKKTGDGLEVVLVMTRELHVLATVAIAVVVMWLVFGTPCVFFVSCDCLSDTSASSLHVLNTTVNWCPHWWRTTHVTY